MPASAPQSERDFFGGDRQGIIALMFAPEEIIFAPTGRCNLHCAHCRVPRTPGPLSADAAIAFLESARGKGIERIGFSGGEPFLEPDFLSRVTAAAVSMDYQFDRAMTNGDWWRDGAELREKLSALFGAGFDGKIGVSVDSYHGQTLGRLAAFFEAAFEASGRRDVCGIVWVTSVDDAPLFGLFRNLAAALGGELIEEEGLPVAIVGAETGDGSGYDDPDALSIPFDRIPYSPPAGNIDWTAPDWFEDDFCAGPGNVLYVHPDGGIAACCGFANERADLILGRLGEHDFDALMGRAWKNRYVRACYDEGLGSFRARLESEGVFFPGKAGDLCSFCDYLCATDLSKRA